MFSILIIYNKNIITFFTLAFLGDCCCAFKSPVLPLQMENEMSLAAKLETAEFIPHVI